jgi:hypothetical protein
LANFPPKSGFYGDSAKRSFSTSLQFIDIGNWFTDALRVAKVQKDEESWESPSRQKHDYFYRQ